MRALIWRSAAAATLLSSLASPPPSTAAAANAAASLPSAARDSWIEIRTPSFVTLTNAGEAKGREIALGFERFRAAMQMLRPQSPLQAPVPTRVLVFRSDDSFDPYKPAGQGKALLAGLFQQSQLANYILLNGYPARGSAMPVVYHELAHSVAHAAFARLPLWLDEGMAELYSTFEVERGELLVGKPVEGHVRTMRERSFVPLDRLFAVDQSSPEYQEGERVGIFYAESWLVVHYLMLGGPERLQHTRAFVEGVARQQPPADAFRAAFGYGFDQLEKELRGYVNAPTFPFLRMPQAELGPPPEATVRALSRGEALFELGSALSLRSDDATAAARAHLEAAAAEGVPDAWAVLASLEERAGNDEAAAGLYRKALGAGAARPLALVLAARARLEAKGAGAEAGLAARELLQRALAADPDYAEARRLLGKTWLLTDDDPKPGIDHLTRAWEQLPGRADVAYDLAMLELKAGHVARAEELVRTVVVPLGSPELAAHARRALEHGKASGAVNAALQSGDAAKAAAALQAALADATDPELRAQLEDRLRQAQAFQTRQAQVDRYNAAVAEANAGKVAESRKALRALRTEVTDESLGKAIDNLLAQLDKALQHQR